MNTLKILIISLLLSQSFVYAENVQYVLSSQEQQRWHQLNSQFRCPTCQNESIEDSQSGLAMDLRLIIKQQIIDGKNDVQIREYMLQRYGNFITYQPPLNPMTAFLWWTPFVLIIFMTYGLYRLIRQISHYVGEDS